MHHFLSSIRATTPAHLFLVRPPVQYLVNPIGLLAYALRDKDGGWTPHILYFGLEEGHLLDSHPCRFTPREIFLYALVLHECHWMWYLYVIFLCDILTWYLYVHRCHFMFKSLSFNPHVRGVYVTLFLELSVGTGGGPAEQDGLWRHCVRRRFEGQARGSESVHWPPVGARRRLCKRSSQVSTSQSGREPSAF